MNQLPKLHPTTVKHQPAITKPHVTTAAHRPGLSHSWKTVAILKMTAMILVLVVVGLTFAWRRKQTQIKQMGSSGFANLITQGTDGAIPYSLYSRGPQC